MALWWEVTDSVPQTIISEYFCFHRFQWDVQRKNSWVGYTDEAEASSQAKIPVPAVLPHTHLKIVLDSACSGLNQKAD